MNAILIARDQAHVVTGDAEPAQFAHGTLCVVVVVEKPCHRLGHRSLLRSLLLMLVKAPLMARFLMLRCATAASINVASPLSPPDEGGARWAPAN
jgi:hypothetical protein